MENPSAPVPAGYALHHISDCQSTNAEALARCEAGEDAGLWIVADRQTAGRGRNGRRWESQPGNLFASLLLRPACPVEIAAQLSFVSGLAVSDCAARFVAGNGQAPSVRLKWPNDLLIDGRKAGGILLESVSRPKSAGLCVVAGIGLNLVSHPEIAGVEATHLGAFGASAPRWDVFSELARSFDHWYCLWDDGRGFAAVREAWLKRAFGVGETIRVRVAGGEEQGVFRGISADGALILELGSGATKSVTSGEVFFAKPQEVRAHA